MAFEDNRPPLARLKRTLGKVDLTGYPDELLDEILEASIAWVEDVATTSFNGRKLDEHYDGNSTNKLTLRRRPATSVETVSVETPILGYTRVYTPAEIQLYRRQGFLMVFTYKLAVEQALLNTLDYQAWGTVFPPLPNAVRVIYTYGYPQYDEANQLTTLDGGATSVAGDKRDPVERNWLKHLQQAAVLDAAASFLAQTKGLEAGLVSGVSFDGYSRQLNPQAFGAQIEAMVTRRDELLNRRRRQFHMATIG